MRGKIQQLDAIVRALEEVAAEAVVGGSKEAHAGGLLRKLRETLAEIRILSGMLYICAACKNIRDEAGKWKQCEVYIRDHSEAEFSHGLCPACAADVFGERHG
jgi:hypothetical protein